MTSIYSNEYFWFARHLFSSTVLCAIIVWSLAPNDIYARFKDNVLASTLLDLLPHRQWLLYAESIGLMGMLAAYFGILMYNEDILTPALDDTRTITDSKTQLAVDEQEDSFLANYAFKETSGIVDLPIMDVCKILYSEGLS